MSKSSNKNSFNNRICIFLVIIVSVALFCAGCFNANKTNSDSANISDIRESTTVTDSTTSDTTVPSDISNSSSPESNNSTDNSRTQFEQFTNQLFTSWLRGNMLDLHYTVLDPVNFGIDNYNISFGEFDDNSFSNLYDEFSQLQRSLSTFTYETLSADQQLTYDILDYYINLELSAKDLYLYQESLNSTIGIQAQLPVLLAEYRLESPKHIEEYLTLLKTIDTYFENIIAFENEKSLAGLFMSDSIADAIISQCESFINGNSDSNLLITSFNNRLDNIPDLDTSKKSEYINQNASIVHDIVVPAYRNLIDGLSKLKGTGVNPGGLCYFPQGKRYYEYLVKSSTGSDKSVGTLLAIIQNRIYNNLYTMNNLYNSNPDLQQQYSTYQFPLTDPNLILEDLQQKIQFDFPEIPSAAYTIKYVDETLKDNLSPAFYLTPPIDKSLENVIYINQNDNYNPDSLYTTLAHEGYPGHLYQTNFFNNVCSCNLRHLLNFGGYVEGWATYVELYSYSFDDDISENLSTFLMLNTDTVLGLYSLMDIQIHYNGWSLDDLKSFVNTYFGTQNDDIALEIFNNIVQSPANYLKYYIGYLEILELRESQKVLLGDSFNIKEFHRQLLTIGPAPFSIIKQYFNLSLSN